MTTYSFIMFGQNGKARIIRPIHILPNNSRGWTLCHRHKDKAQPVTYFRFGKKTADGLVDMFTCIHCKNHADKMKLKRNNSELQPELINV